jgi:tRNA pseudouridine38-40 synthase
LSSSTKRVRLVVAYDGTDFSGWAPQRGRRTVHGTLTEAVRQVSGEDCETIGASRTDSGAHAVGQVCCFDTTRPIEPKDWIRSLNAVLPRDLAVQRAGFVPRDFNPRFFALDRTYRYRVLTGPPDPMRSRYTFEWGRPLDARAMHGAAQALVGRNDFLAFSQLSLPGQNTVRDLKRIAVRQVRDEVWIEVTATAFVRGMMRRISGALWEVGRGRIGRAEIEAWLAMRDKRKIRRWPTVLPAGGLCLMQVRYGRSPRDHRFDGADEE